MANALRTVTDRFSLVDLYRKHTFQNGRKYLIQAVANAFNNPETQERIRLGEMFGYYGHGRREMHFNKTGSLRLPETSVIMVEGAPVIVDNVPSNRTLEISVSDDGIVSHTQELLNTPTGLIVDGMERSNAGGWSWATKGGQQAGKSIVREYAGMDYVGIPNFLSLDRLVAMNESAGDEEARVVAGLLEAGYTEKAAVDVYHHFRNMRETTSLFESAQRATDMELELFIATAQNDELRNQLATKAAEFDALDGQQSQQLTAMLESAKANRSARRKAVRELLDRMPFHVTKEQRQALINQETSQDISVVMALFESVAMSSVRDLPVATKYQPAPAVIPTRTYNDDGVALEFVERTRPARR